MITSEMDGLSRRAFLTAGGALVVALAAPADLANAAEKNPFGRSVVRPDKLSSYISIDPDGTVVAYYGKIDGGQGLQTAIGQMVAEEIDVPGSACASSWAIPGSPSISAARPPATGCGKAA